MTTLREEEVNAIADKAARAAVLEMLLTLGVDAHDPKAIKAMQADFAHLRNWRESIDLVKKRTLMTAVGVIVTGLLGLIAMYFGRGFGH